MTVEYKSKYGVLRFTGGKPGGWRMTQLKGLGPPEAEYSYHAFAGLHGQKLAAVRYLARSITIKCDIYPKDVSPQKGAKILSSEGELVFRMPGRMRKIACRCISFTKQEKRSAVAEAVIQFVADSPFFYGDEIVVQAARTIPNLVSPFTLPRVFSQRFTQAEVYVSGDTDTEPTVRVRIPEDMDAFTVKNETTGASITLEGGFFAGEEIEINIKNRTAESNISGSVLHRLSKDSYLSRFTLAEGKNVISAEAASNVNCTLSYRNSYREAMY